MNNYAQKSGFWPKRSRFPRLRLCRCVWSIPHRRVPCVVHLSKINKLPSPKTVVFKAVLDITVCTLEHARVCRVCAVCRPESARAQPQADKKPNYIYIKNRNLIKFTRRYIVWYNREHRVQQEYSTSSRDTWTWEAPDVEMRSCPGAEIRVRSGKGAGER